MNELVSIEQNEVKPRISIANSHAMFVALSKCKDLVQITDDSFIIQYINRATELYLGFRNDEVKGKSIWEIHNGTEYQSAISHQLIRGKEWEGLMMCRRKYGESIVLPCRVVGSSVQNRWVSFTFVYISFVCVTIVWFHPPNSAAIANVLCPFYRVWMTPKIWRNACLHTLGCVYLQLACK